ncbi:PEP-CTERM sorting domain-containing protein [Mucisphaera calidilacus]|uniref:Ice-binding protein C-terminal domain-containing protein n=1 Tax=Mucisphaera calidilacus TaxID=2527982 RepID=A0A518BW30_9BACT|nr:PEP-CTERM sorting domain-containing protein [Mucisphaera calidilacus]QDU71186.1 hypothetical protein Pan265_10350 [Mucisphaera calidilacus]
MKTLALTTAASLALVGAAQAATVLDDFSGGVTAINHPDGNLNSGVYTDITNVAYGTAEDGGGFLKITDGGFTNGIYVIFESAIPADGIYAVELELTVVQTANDNTNIDLYEIGAVVNGVHRDAAGKLAALSAANAGTGMVSVDTEPRVSLGPITVTTSGFTAAAGDNLLVAFSTDLTSGDFNGNTGWWNGSHVEIDDIKLVAVPEPASLAMLALGGLALVRRSA